MRSRHIQYILLVLGIIGVLTSIYLVKHHYDLASHGICDISSTISCSLVNTSKYSELFHIPVAAYGILWFLVMLGLTTAHMKGRKTKTHMLVWSIAGTGFVGYLVTAEILLKAICPYCTIVHAIVIIILGLTILLYRKRP